MAVDDSALVGAAARACGDAIERAIARLQASEPLYGVVIAYHIERPDEFVEPYLGALLVSERHVRDGDSEWEKWLETWTSPRFAHLPEAMRAQLTDRSRWSNDRKWGNWNPAGRRFFDIPELGVREWKDQWSERTRALIAPSEPAWRRFYVRVGRELNEREWSSRVPMTDDFVVFATDLDMGDALENVRAGVPYGQRELLVERGWMPRSVLEAEGAGPKR